MKNPISRTRGEAAEAIDRALDVLHCGATSGQLCDLADAFEAFKCQAYGIACVAACAALEIGGTLPGRGAPLRSRSLTEIGEEFRAMTRFSLDTGCVGPVSRGEIEATARLIVLQHGPWAGAFARRRTEIFLERRDETSAAAWLRIHRAIAAIDCGGPDFRR